MENLTTTNIWLGILAVVSLLEFLMILVVGVLAFKMYQRVMTTIETVERVHIAPLHARVDGVLDEVQRLVDKVKHAQESVSDALRHVAGTGTAVAGVMKARTWPILSVIQGLKSAAAALMKNSRREHDDSPYGAM